ncbi:MAG: amidohydrolase family protein, partial [Gemmataceae bacterium]
MFRMLRRFAAVLAALILMDGACRLWAAEPSYDVVIRHGQIVDGSGNPWFQGDVAIRGDRLAAVGRVPAGKARREIDAKGLIVAPGFIDMHSHSDFVLLE